ncbi:MAG: phosphate acyltransferase [Oscillospiraceae bacterium]
MESVKHKAIHDPVAGQADILLVPFIEIGNVLYKACTYIAGKTMASTICGASCPVVITSRADTPGQQVLFHPHGCPPLHQGLLNLR